MRNSDLNVVEGVDDNFGGLVFQGSADDELFVSEAGDDTTINARGGDDTIELAASDDVDRSTDLINTGGGSDTIILNENNTAIVRSDGFDVENDVFDVSNLEGVDSFDDINFDVIDNEESNNNGEFFFFEAGTASITVDEELQGDLTEDNFIFADDDDAVAEAEDDSAEDDEDEGAGAGAEADEDDDEEEEEVAEADDDDEDDLNVIDISDQEGVAEAEGTADADLIIASADASNRIDAGGGDDVIELAEGFDVDLISTGAGNDTIIANEGGIALANDFNENRDVLDFSGVDGAESFDDIEITRDDESDEDFLGLTEVKSGDSTRIFVSEEAGDALDEDNFIFVDDAVA